MNSYNEEITWKHFPLHSAEPFFSIHNPLFNDMLEILLGMEENSKNQLHPQSGLLARSSAAGEKKEEVAKAEGYNQSDHMRESSYISFLIAVLTEAPYHPNGGKRPFKRDQS